MSICETLSKEQSVTYAGEVLRTQLGGKKGVVNFFSPFPFDCIKCVYFILK